MSIHVKILLLNSYSNALYPLTDKSNYGLTKSNPVEKHVAKLCLTEKEAHRIFIATTYHVASVNYTVFAAQSLQFDIF